MFFSINTKAKNPCFKFFKCCFTFTERSLIGINYIIQIVSPITLKLLYISESKWHRVLRIKCNIIQRLTKIISLY